MEGTSIILALHLSRTSSALVLHFCHSQSCFSCPFSLFVLKVVRVHPLGVALSRLFDRADTAKLLNDIQLEDWKTDAELVNKRDNGTMNNLYESVGWMDSMNNPSAWSALEGEHAATQLPIIKVGVSLCMDGFLPFSGSKKSVTPVLFSVLSLPESIRMRHEYIILSAVLPG